MSDSSGDGIRDDLVGEAAGPWVDASGYLKRRDVLFYCFCAAVALGLGAFWLLVGDGQHRIVGYVCLGAAAIGAVGGAHQWRLYRKNRCWVRALTDGVLVSDPAGTRSVAERAIRAAELDVQRLLSDPARVVCGGRLVIAAEGGELELRLTYTYRPAEGDPLAALWDRLGGRVIRRETKTPVRRVGVPAGELPELSDRVNELARDPARKVEAVKAYRDETGAGLAEAKEAVDAFVHSLQR